jgi:hypothetical protein
MVGNAPFFGQLIRWTTVCFCFLATATILNVTVMAQAKQYATWSSISNGSDIGSGSVRKTSTGVWDFSSISDLCIQHRVPCVGKSNPNYVQLA